MKICVNCSEEIDDSNNYCEPCAYIRLEKYIVELYAKQERNKNKSGIP